MPEKEFELYLALLGKLLRLSPQQKSSIEAELRDHFEERFEALVRSGVPRDRAIHQTLDEFGDVAGLAHEFTHLSRKHIRRRIMQGATATAGLAAAVVIWATLFRGPEPAVGPAPNVIAQDKAGDTPRVERLPGQPVDDGGNPVVPHKPYLIGSLVPGADPNVEWIDPGRFMPTWSTRPIDVGFVETPLPDVLRYFSQTLGINMVLDVRALNEAGMTGDELVSASIHQTPAYACLNQVLHDIGANELTWITEDEVIKVTTKEAAENQLTTRYLNVRDLLDAGYTHEQLAKLVIEFSTGPWEQIDGLGGVVSNFGDLLIARNFERTLAEAECVLAGLRSKARVRWVGEPEMHARLFAALDEPTDISMTDTSLRQVVAFLAGSHKIPMGLDVAALAEAGVTGDESVSIVVSGIKLRSALRLVLENFGGLDFTIRDGALWVTTEDVAQSSLDNVMYNVSDIIGDDQEQMQRLLDVVMAQTSGPWEQIDGIGGGPVTLKPGEFACRQTTRVHDEIAAVLNVVLESLEASGGDRKYFVPAPVKLESRFYRLDAETAEDIARLIPELVEPGTWKIADDNVQSGVPSVVATRVGSIHRLAAGRMLLKLESGDLVAVPDKLPNHGPQHPENVEARQQAIDASNSQVAVVPQSVLIVTHTPAVLKAISKLLKSLLSGDGNWKTEGGDKVKFIAPGYQEGTWTGPLGGPDGPAASTPERIGGFMGGGTGGGFIGGGGGGVSLEPSLNP